MSISIPIDVLFFVVPLLILFIAAQGYSSASGRLGSNRDWFYMFFGPIAFVVAFASWGIYLKWFAP